MLFSFRPRLFTLIFSLTFLFLSTASAQTCFTELSADYTPEQLQAEATGVDAARLLRRTVALLEPALPSLSYTPGEFNLQPGDEGFDDATFLQQRELLPADWQPDTLTTETWQQMVDNLSTWYEGGTVAAGGLTRADLIDTLSTLISRAGSSLQPVALVASDPADRNAVAFWGLLYTTSVYPRLVVVRPPENLSLEGGVGAALAGLETCALPLTNYISAPLDTAKRLFLANNQSRMYVAGTEPDGLSFLEVAAGEETSYLTFEAEDLAPFTSYAAVFDGPNVNPVAVLRLLPQVRTNMNPRQVTQLLLAD